MPVIKLSKTMGAEFSPAAGKSKELKLTFIWKLMMKTSISVTRNTTTLFSWWVTDLRMELTTGSSRTLGGPTGEKMDLPRSREVSMLADWKE